MKITVHSEPNLEYVQIDDTYSEEEQHLIMLELEFLSSRNKMYEPDKSSSARNDNGEVLKQNKAVFLDSAYGDRNLSNILTLNRKLFVLDLPFDDLHPVFRVVKHCDRDTTLVSYYENQDHYKPHYDNSMITALTYFYKQPKKFTGGDLIIGSKVKKTLEPMFNRTYIFPGLLTHEVTQVELDDEFLGNGYGRYCITNFMRFA